MWLLWTRPEYTPFRTVAHEQAISAFKYRVVVISPEQIMKPDGGFERLLKSPRLGGVSAGVQGTRSTTVCGTNERAASPHDIQSHDHHSPVK